MVPKLPNTTPAAGHIDISLKPIDLVPFSKGGYSVQYSMSPEIFKKLTSLSLCVGSDQSRVDLQRSLQPDPERLLTGLLKIFREKGTWGRQIPCWITGAVAGTKLVKSNVQPLTMVVEPAPVNHWTNVVLGMQPSNLLHPSWQTPPVFFSPSEGRRLLGLRSDWPLFYVDQAGRLETSTAKRGFDRYTFWLSNYAAPIESFQAIWNPTIFLQTLKATHIGAYGPGYSSSTWDLVASFAPNYPENIYFACTDSRILCVRNSRVEESAPPDSRARIFSSTCLRILLPPAI